MKRMLLWMLLAALLLPGIAMGAEENEASGPIEVVSPGFVYHTLGTEAAGLVSLPYDHAKVVHEKFVLSDGFLSIGYTREDAYTISIFPEGEPLTCWNADMSLRWVLDDERLAGAWYTELVELADGLLLGIDRSAPGGGQVASLLMLEKDTGEIRWQLEGVTSEVWISDFRPDADGNILVASNGGLQDREGGTGTLTALDAADGKALWTASYLEPYGAMWLRSVCPMGDGVVLYGIREEDAILLYTDGRGEVRAWFNFQPGHDAHGYTSLHLMPVAEDVVYLQGWEAETTLDRNADLPYNNRTLCLMRITPDTFAPEQKWWGAE